MYPRNASHACLGVFADKSIPRHAQAQTEQDGARQEGEEGDGAGILPHAAEDRRGARQVC